MGSGQGLGDHYLTHNAHGIPHLDLETAAWHFITQSTTCVHAADNLQYKKTTHTYIYTHATFFSQGTHLELLSHVATTCASVKPPMEKHIYAYIHTLHSLVKVN